MSFSYDLIDDVMDLIAESALIQPNEIKNYSDREIVFLLHLEQLMTVEDRPILTRPRLHDEHINIFKLAQVVQKLGGFEQVKENKRWKDVARMMGSSQFHVSTFKSLKHSYMRYLEPFLEHIHLKTPKPCCASFEKPFCREINASFLKEFPWNPPSFTDTDSAAKKSTPPTGFPIVRKTLRAQNREQSVARVSSESEAVEESDTSVKQRRRRSSSFEKLAITNSDSSYNSEFKSFNVGDTILVKYPRVKKPYEANIIERKLVNNENSYLIHYYGWTDMYDEWVDESRILSLADKGKPRAKGKRGRKHKRDVGSDVSPHHPDDAPEKKRKSRSTYNSLQDEYIEAALVNSLKEYEETSGTKAGLSLETESSSLPPSSGAQMEIASNAVASQHSKSSLSDEDERSTVHGGLVSSLMQVDISDSESFVIEADALFTPTLKKLEEKKAKLTEYMDTVVELCKLQGYSEREVLLENASQLVRSLQDNLLENLNFCRMKLQANRK